MFPKSARTIIGGFMLALLLVTAAFPALAAEPKTDASIQVCGGAVVAGYVTRDALNDVTFSPTAGFAPANAPHIYVGSNGGPGNDVRALMPFPAVTSPAGIPAGSCVLSATLAVFVDGITGEPRPVVAGHIAAGPIVIHPTAPQVLALGWNTFDVTPQVQAWLDGTYPNTGLGLREEMPGWPFMDRIRSRNHAVAAHHPRLIVDYQLP